MPIPVSDFYLLLFRVLKGLVMKFFVFFICLMIFIGSLAPAANDTAATIVFGLLSVLTFASLFVSDEEVERI
jgi:hypothetical protein